MCWPAYTAMWMSPSFPARRKARRSAWSSSNRWPAARPSSPRDLPGVRTVVEQGVDGFLVPPGDAEALAQALSTMMADPQATRAMGCAGRDKVVREYRWEAIGDRLEALYRETVGA